MLDHPDAICAAVRDLLIEESAFKKAVSDIEAAKHRLADRRQTLGNLLADAGLIELGSFKLTQVAP